MRQGLAQGLVALPLVPVGVQGPVVQVPGAPEHEVGVLGRAEAVEGVALGIGLGADGGSSALSPRGGTRPCGRLPGSPPAWPRPRTRRTPPRSPAGRERCRRKPGTPPPPGSTCRRGWGPPRAPRRSWRPPWPGARRAPLRAQQTLVQTCRWNRPTGWRLEHGVEGGHPEHVPLRHPQRPGHLLHGRQAHEAEFPLGDVQGRQRSRQLVRVFPGNGPDFRHRLLAEPGPFAAGKPHPRRQGHIAGLRCQRVIHG